VHFAARRCAIVKERKQRGSLPPPSPLARVFSAPPPPQFECQVGTASLHLSAPALESLTLRAFISDDLLRAVGAQVGATLRRLAVRSDAPTHFTPRPMPRLVAPSLAPFCGPLAALLVEDCACLRAIAALPSRGFPHLRTATFTRCPALSDAFIETLTRAAPALENLTLTDSGAPGGAGGVGLDGAAGLGVAAAPPAALPTGLYVLSLRGAPSLRRFVLAHRELHSLRPPVHRWLSTSPLAFLSVGGSALATLAIHGTPALVLGALFDRLPPTTAASLRDLSLCGVQLGGSDLVDRLLESGDALPALERLELSNDHGLTRLVVRHPTLRRLQANVTDPELATATSCLDCACPRLRHLVFQGHAAVSRMRLACPALVTLNLERTTLLTAAPSRDLALTGALAIDCPLCHWQPAPSLTLVADATRGALPASLLPPAWDFAPLELHAPRLATLEACPPQLLPPDAVCPSLHVFASLAELSFVGAPTIDDAMLAAFVALCPALRCLTVRGCGALRAPVLHSTSLKEIALLSCVHLEAALVLCPNLVRSVQEAKSEPRKWEQLWGRKRVMRLVPFVLLCGYDHMSRFRCLGCHTCVSGLFMARAAAWTFPSTRHSTSLRR